MINPQLKSREDQQPKIEEFKAINGEDSQLEDNNKWITNKRKRSIFKKKGSYMADRFEQLSQAFLSLGNNPAQTNNSSGMKQVK